MCGFAGFFQNDRTREERQNTVKKMCDAIRHRGPDSEGFWIDEQSYYTVGHRRLSIIDLSEAGHQPMISPSGRYIIAFNGEVYNYKDIAQDLISHHGCQFKGHSDTEVILSAMEIWGIENAVKRFTGMFSFALWDRIKKVVYLVRDRFGKKPLYYHLTDDGGLIFGSELHSFRVNSQFPVIIDPKAAELFFHYNYIPAPYSVYRDTKKLGPGTILKISCISKPKVMESITYWSALEAARTGITNPWEGTEGEAIDEVEKILYDAVKIRTFSDVPIGAFLSGGIDSSLVVSLFQKISPTPINTFTIGFKSPNYNEATFAMEVAKILGTNHKEVYLEPNEGIKIIEELPKIFDEPFADSSQIPTYLVSKITRSFVTVALSGDGGDEFFGGYNRYLHTAKIWNKIRNVPLPMRNLLVHILNSISPTSYDSLLKAVGRGGVKSGLSGDRIHKFFSIIDSESPSRIYEKLTTFWPVWSHDLIKANKEFIIGSETSLENAMMLEDVLHYMVDDILVKVDRASMAVSLETRAPLLDHRLFELSWRMPLSYKIRNGKGKWLLRQVLSKHIPLELIDRPKMGFGVPIGDWIRGPMKDWAYYSIENLANDEYVRHLYPRIKKKFEEHCSGDKNWQHQLWGPLMWGLWKKDLINDK